MTIRKIDAGRVITHTINTFVGQEGTIFYDEQTGEFRLSDGITEGGIPLGSGGGGYVLTTATTNTLGGVRIGAGISVSANGTISVNTGTAFNLNTATTSTLGGVKIGVGINVSEDGTISVNSSTYFTLTAGTDTAVSTSTGNVTVWNISTLQSVTNRGSTTSNSINIASIAASASTTTGALIVAGGVGVAGNIFIDGDIRDINGSLIHIVTTSTAPNRVNGQVWFNLEDGRAYIKYDNNWVDLSPSIIPPTSTYLDGLVIEDTTIRTVDTTATTVYIDSNLDVSGNLNAQSIYDNGNRVVTQVLPSGSTYIGVANVITTGTQTSFTIVNLGVQTITAGTDTAVSSSTGTVTIWNTSTLQTITNRGNTTTNSIYASSLYDNSNRVVTSVIATGSDYIGIVNLQSTGTQTSFGIVNLGVQTITAGTDTAVSSSTGTITIWNTSTLQTITNRGNTTTNRIVILNTLSTAGVVTENALYVAGGVGIDGNLTVSGPTLFKDNVTFTGTATYVLTTNTVYTDNIIELHSPGSSSNLISNDGADIGFTFRYFTNSDQRAGLIFSHDTRTLEFYSQGIGAIENNTVIDNGIYGAFKTGTILIDNSTISTNTTTGALIVAGGAGIGGNLNVGGSLNVNAIYDTGNRVVTSVIATGSNYIGVTNLISTGTQTSFTIVNLGVQTLTAGTDTAVSSSTGTVTIWTTSTLQSITNRGATTTNVISITNTTSSISSTTGALIVSGGVGISKDVWVGGVLYAKDLGSPTNRIGKIYLEGQTIDLGGTLISTGPDGGMLIQKPNGDLEKLATRSLTLGSTGTGSIALSVVDGTLIIKSSTVNVEGLVTTGTVTATNIIVNGLINSTSTTTGALIVSGGVGIGGNVYAGSIYDSGNRVVTSVIATGSDYIGIVNLISTGTQTSFTVVNLGVQTLTAGTDTAVSSSTGTVTVWTTSTLQSVTNRGATTTNIISITNTTNATSTATGALVVSGGVGIGGNLYVSGEIVAQKLTIEYTTITTTVVVTDDIIKTVNTTSSIGTTTGALVVGGGVGIGGNLYIGGLINIGQTSTILGSEIITTATIGNYASNSNASSTGTTSSFLISNLTASTSTNTGALIVTGGMGIGGALYVNTTSFIAGAEIITSATINIFASKTTIVAGTDTAISTSTGEVTIWTTSTLQSVTNRGNSTTNVILINNFTNSTGTNTGALIVGGGVGIGGALYVNTTSFIAGAKIITTGTIEQYAVTPTGIQTLTNKTIIVPSGGALYFADDVLLSQEHGATIPYQQTSAAPRMYTNADFNTGILWKDAGEFNPDDGWNVQGNVTNSSSLPVGYTGAVYDAYVTNNDNHVWYWAALSITDLKPGDHYYDDINFTINICFVYLNPDSGNLTYAMLDLTPR